MICAVAYNYYTFHVKWFHFSPGDYES